MRRRPAAQAAIVIPERPCTRADALAVTVAAASGGDRGDRGERAEAREASAVPDAPPVEADAEAGDDENAPQHTAVPHRARGERFRRRHRSTAPIALYGGSIDPGKGCEELFEYFSAFRERGGEASLALMGVKLMTIPEVPFVRFAGQLSDEERVQALEAATVSWSCRRPSRACRCWRSSPSPSARQSSANGRSDVLVEHVSRSNAGLYYENRDEFVEALTAAHDRRSGCGALMGRNGRDYVRRTTAGTSSWESTTA